MRNDGPLLDPALTSELACVRLPGRHELDHLALSGSPFEELGLKRSDPAPDLEHASVLEARLGSGGNHLELELVETLLATALEASPRHSRPEHLLTRPARQQLVTGGTRRYSAVCSSSSAAELMQ